jgi:hypothetical protein
MVRVARTKTGRRRSRRFIKVDCLGAVVGSSNVSALVTFRTFVSA